MQCELPTKLKLRGSSLTRYNLNEVIFENHDARLLIEDVVTSTSACIYYYHDGEITVKAALEIWNKAVGADGFYEYRIVV